MTRFWLLTFVVLALGCRSTLGQPVAAWIDWDPQDPERLAELRRILEEDGDLDLLEWHLEYDPLSLVPDDRLRRAFPRLRATDERWLHCQLGVTGSSVGILRFTPRRVSDTQASGQSVHCDAHDPERRRSRCEFSEPAMHHLGDETQAFELDPEIDPTEGRRLMELLVEGRYRSDMPDFDPSEWPSDWNARTLGMRLGRPAIVRAVPGEPLGLEPDTDPHLFGLSFPGCGCWINMTLEYGSPRTAAEIAIVDLDSWCI